MITATKKAITARRDDLRVARLVAVIGASGRYQRHTGTHKDRWEQAGGRDDDACRAEAFDSRTPWTGSCSPTSSSLSLKASADRFPCRRGRYVVRAILLTSSGKRGGAFHFDDERPSFRKFPGFSPFCLAHVHASLKYSHTMITSEIRGRNGQRASMANLPSTGSTKSVVPGQFLLLVLFSWVRRVAYAQIVPSSCEGEVAFCLAENGVRSRWRR